ncbi:mechanosensitive ion channel family protein [Haloflavibacter putidus]|uniref:Mechanosensing system component YbdG n=1 Tax=Haloflavibacter putidus TaxID=2576776 RepID=A0A507ZRL3_9FLAO|nr:mechanosensitive ion channel domain-containing protein [Haloflavibacter putidus]TQD40260.1 mechanosensitive ion channel [Haloflavibacter putidus]
MEGSELTTIFYDWFLGFGWKSENAKIANLLLNITALALLSYLLNYVLRKILKSFLFRIARRTATKFDDYLFKNNVLSHFSNLLTLILVHWIVPEILTGFSYLKEEAVILIQIGIIVVIILLIRSLLLTVRDYLKTLNSFKDKPIESYIQVFMIFTWFVGFILLFSVITGESVVYFLTALGAVSAVILLIFKDTILGFVASIQVAVNDTVRIGDWITMNKYGADGDVIEINLSSVKVRNFDKTITTIPTYYLISDSFKNWRGMSASGGRRIKRAVIVKTSSIHFLTEQKIKELKKIGLIKDYLTNKEQEIEKFNQDNKIDRSLPINGRNLTNFGVFREYLNTYLQKHPKINQEMTVMCRQLEQTPQGIPLEIYAFSKDKVWRNYENIMGDIFDHLLAATPYFDLEIFELPTAKDFNRISLNHSKIE